MTAFVNVDGETVLEGRLVIPNIGPWWCELVFEGAPDFEPSVTLSIGAARLVGAFSSIADGTFGEQRRSRLVGGAAGWSTLVPPQHYHNDAGVNALSVAQDVARLAGETLGSFAPANATLGVDYVREAGVASRALEDVIGGVPWHVAFDGTTVVGERSSSNADAEDYSVIDANPLEQIALITVDDLTKIGVGSILTERLDTPLTIRELEVTLGVDSIRARAWGSNVAGGRGQLAGLFEEIVKSITAAKLFGRYRYRVVRMSGDRVELQAASSAAGLPDILPVSMRPGVAGAHAQLTGGSIVLVEFIEGDRTMPILSAFAGRDEEGNAPDELDFEVVTTLRLGGPGAVDAVALAPSIDSQFDNINAAIDAFAAAVPVPNDGGLAIHTALVSSWGTGAPPKPSSNVGATKARAE